VERVDLGLAEVGLSEADGRRLRAMLMMALADGSLRARWRLVDASHARVIILDAAKIDRLPGLNQDNRIVAVLAGTADSVPAGARTLDWPIRAEALLALLRDAEAQAHAPRADATSGRPLIRLAELLRRTNLHATHGDAWLVTGMTRAPMYIAPQRKQFFCTESLRTLHRFDVRNDFEIAPIPATALPIANERPKPIAMLQWSIGLLTGTLGPLPWIDAAATLQLQRFPEFQILHHEPAHRRLAAAFSRPVAGIDAAIEITKLDRHAVCSFVNGAELCGYLRTSDQPPSVARSAARTTVGSKRSLIQLLRRALGIETTDG
jgi:hypothetical protein